MAVQNETELYAPVKSFFASRGYEVKAEIRGCDLVAVRADEALPTVAELKKTFTLPLLLQGIDRQRAGARVWLAVERNRTKRGAHNQRFQELTMLCRRLGLGFLTVTFYKTKAPMVDVWCEPSAIAASAAAVGSVAAEAAADYTAAAQAAQAAQGAQATGGRRRGAARLLKEFDDRSGDYNVGGSTRRKLVTAYRERSLQCALALVCRGPSAPRDVRALTALSNAQALLRDNVYGWFARVEKGVYALSPKGSDALREYAEVTRVWAARFPWAAEWETAAGKEPTS